MDNRLEDFCSMLRNTGMFDELEVKILSALMSMRKEKKNKCTASEISKVALMSVTNTYKYLYSLQEKGIIESNKDKNKVFWLSNTSNPFPRLQSFLAREYLKKKDLFSKAQQVYENFVPINGHVWLGEKLYEKYESDFESRAAFLMDAAHEEIIIVAERVPNDIVILEAIKRAAVRDVKIKVLVRQMEPAALEKLKQIGIEARLGRVSEKAILSDGEHGIVQNSGKGGFWFTNYSNEYRQKLEKLWNEAEKL